MPFGQAFHYPRFPRVCSPLFCSLSLSDRGVASKEVNQLPPSLTILSSLEHLDMWIELSALPALPASLTSLRLGPDTPLPTVAQVRRTSVALV